MPAKRGNSDTRLKKLSNNLGLSTDTIVAKRNEMRTKLKKLKSCIPVVELLCSRVIPFEEVKLDVETQHLTVKQAKSMELKQLVKMYNKLLTVSSMQNDAFKHMFEIVSFLMQFAARYEEESKDFQKELTKIRKNVDKALQQKAKAKPKAKPTSRKKRADLLLSNGNNPGDCSGDEQNDTMLSLFS